MNNRLDYIDALRGVAISGVVLVHCGQVIAGLPELMQNVTDYGGRGVQLFFVLSSLVLATVYSGRAVNNRDFLARRFFRIAPMFYLAAVFYSVTNGFGPQRFAPEGIGIHQLVLTGLFLHGWSRDSFNAVVPGGWSIADEAMFYLIFRWLIMRITNLRRAVFMFMAAAGLARLTVAAVPRLYGHDELSVVFANFSFPAQLAAFLGGLVVFEVLRMPRLIEIRDRGRVLSGVGLAAVIGAIAVVSLCNVQWLRNTLVADVLFIGLVVGVALARPVWLVNGVMTKLGEISFSVYLLHFAILDGVNFWVVPLLLDFSPVGQLVIVFGLVLSAAAVVGSITYRYIEMPGINLGRRLAARLHTA